MKVIKIKKFLLVKFFFLLNGALVLIAEPTSMMKVTQTVAAFTDLLSMEDIYYEFLINVTKNDYESTF